MTIEEYINSKKHKPFDETSYERVESMTMPRYALYQYIQLRSKNGKTGTIVPHL